MIVGNLSTIERELCFYPAELQKGIRFLLERDIMALSPGEYAIDGKMMFAKVSEYETESAARRRPERHEAYIDIQCIASGRERIGIGTLEHAGMVDDDKLRERDVLYYDSESGMREEELLTLRAGMLAVFFPWDVHRPNVRAGDGPETVKKIVVKVAVCGMTEKEQL